MIYSWPLLAYTRLNKSLHKFRRPEDKFSGMERDTFCYLSLLMINRYDSKRLLLSYSVKVICLLGSFAAAEGSICIATNNMVIKIATFVEEIYKCMQNKYIILDLKQVI